MKVYFIHNLPAFNTFEGMCRIMHIDNDKYDLEWDAQNPEIIIASEWIYMSKKIFRRFLTTQRQSEKIMEALLSAGIEFTN